MDLNNIPKQPGCYIFKNKQQIIIYIGKSKSLHNRVKQYFYAAASDGCSDGYNKYAEMAREICEVETIVTDTETNALILEYHLIKKHKPKYNSLLKNTYPYPFIKIDLSQEYPAISISDKEFDDGCEYFGNFYGIGDAFRTIELIHSIWQTPICQKESFSGNKPCLNYHIGKCMAPCGKMIDSIAYREKINEIVKCLNGNFYSTISRLNKEMQNASKTLNFEKAASIRDSINGLNRLKKKQKRLYTKLGNKDVYVFLRAFKEQCFSIFYIKNGITLSRADFPDLCEPDEKRLEAFARDNKQGIINIENGALMTTCLLDISADKLFVQAPSKTKPEQLAKKLKSGYKALIQ